MGWTAPKKGVQERQGKGRDGMGKEMTETESDAGKETHDNTKLYGKLTDSFQGVRQRAAGTDIRNGRVRKGHQEWACTERTSEVVKAIALALERNIRTPSFVCSSRMAYTVP